MTEETPAPESVDPAAPLSAALIEKLILDRLYFYSRFRNVSDEKAEATWNSGVDGTMTYQDRLEDDLFRELREQHRDDDLVEFVNRFERTFKAAIRTMARGGLINAFTEGYTIYPDLHVPLPNRWSQQRSRLRIRGLTLTAEGWLKARRIYEERYRIE